MSAIYVTDSYKMNTAPEIVNNLTYETKRVGTSVYYRFKIVTEPSKIAFGYDLRLDITLNNKKILLGGKIKNSTLSRWSNSIVNYFPNPNGWYEVKNITDKISLPCDVKFYSTQTSGISESYGRIVYVLKYIKKDTVTKVSVKVGGNWKPVKSVYIKVGSNWKPTKSVYIKTGSNWKQV